MKFLGLATAAALTSVAAGHSIFTEFEVNGVTAGKFNALRLPTYDGPIEDVTNSAMACNGGPNPLTQFSPNVIDVPAGAEITVRWTHTLDTDYRTGLIIDASHKGPIMAYLSKVGNAATAAIPNGGWFKIHEEGFDGSQWAVDKLIANRGYKFKIPTCVAPGNYLMRVELIALHAAGNYPGAQLYMECAQINITGGGSLSPSTVNFPGAYSGSDPGIKFNLYVPNISYTIPGPRPVTCGGTQPTTTARTTSAGTTLRTTTTSSRTTTTTSTTTSRTTTTGGSTGGSPLYGQCGGIGWTGPTTCASGRCVANGAYYSQCTP